jgi:hypothetical protein
LIAIAVLALMVAPGTWVRSPIAKPDFSQILTVTPLPTEGFDLGEVELVGAWHLESPNSHFGSYSALLAMPDCQLFSASDTGKLLRFPMPDCEGETVPEPVIERFAGRSVMKKKLIDIESLARDPQTGRLWVGYEGTNTIERLESDLTGAKSVRPAAMRGWSSNSGPEAMARLDNGHFIVISEGREGYWDSDYPALLFEGDPLEEPGVRNFSFEPPAGYRPVDMAQMPDGRVLILVREFVLGLPPTFNVKMVVVDPADIAVGEVWRGREIASISAPELEDNYEGLAIEQGEGDLLDLWLISDDNNTSFQRTMLLKLVWSPGSLPNPDEEKARENPARPSNSSD